MTLPSPFRTLSLSPPSEFQTEKGGAPVSDQNGQGQRDDGDGKDDVGRAVAEISDAPSDEDLIYNIV